MIRRGSWSDARGRLVGRLVPWILASLVAAPAYAWQTVLGTGGASDARVGAVTANGDLVAAGVLENQFAVIRFAAAAGTERWRFLLPDVGHDTLPPEAEAILVDVNDDVVVAGSTGMRDTITVVKLAGATGGLLWRYDLPQGSDSFAGVATLTLDPAGDLLVVCYASAALGTNGFTVLKISPDTGMAAYAVLYERQQPHVTALLPDGDLVVSLFDFRGPFTYAPPKRAVVRIDGATGAEVWRTPIAPDAKPYAGAIAVTPTALLMPTTVDTSWYCPPAPGCPPPQLSAAFFRLDPVTGAVIATDPLAPFAGIQTRPDRSFVLLRFEQGPAPGSELVALDLSIMQPDGSIGATRRITPPDPLSGLSGGVAVTATGDLVVTGALPPKPRSPLDPNHDIAIQTVVARLSADDLATVWLRVSDALTPYAGFLAHAPVVSLPDRVYVPGTTYVPAAPERTIGFGVVAFDFDDGETHVCGDLIVDSSEVCDDGYSGNHDCCASDCHSTTGADGTTCHVSDICAPKGQCMAGACQSTPVTCAPCERCDPINGCTTAPSTICRRSSGSNVATLAVRQRLSGAASLSWTLENAPDTTRADFGDPRSTSTYALCGFDSQGTLILHAVAPAGPCGTKPCWRTTGRGFTYRDRLAAAGVSHLSLRAGTNGTARLRVHGRGGGLSLPRLPIHDDAVTVELHRSDDAVCWSATHTHVIADRRTRFRATGN